MDSQAIDGTTVAQTLITHYVKNGVRSQLSNKRLKE